MQLIFTLIFVLAIHSLQATPTYKFHQTIESADNDPVSSIHQLTKGLLFVGNRNALFRIIDLQTKMFIGLMVPNNNDNDMIRVFFAKQGNSNTLIIRRLEYNFQKFYVFSGIENSIVESKWLSSAKPSEEEIQTTLNAPFSLMNGSYHDGQKFYNFFSKIKAWLDVESINKSSSLKAMVNLNRQEVDCYSFCFDDQEETIFLGHGGFFSEWRLHV